MNDIMGRIVDWNRLRNNTDYSKALELSMLTEELNELAEAETPVQELDAAADLLFVAVGTLYKLSEHHGVNPADVMTIVCNANDAKGMDKDRAGKIRKPNWFSRPDCPDGPLERLLRAAENARPD